MRDTTIEQYIDSSRKTTLKMTDYFFKGVLVDTATYLKVLDDSILIDYDGLLDKYRKTWTFSDSEFRTYKYNPWKVSLDIYGTTELWFLVLHANEMYSADEFNERTVSLYTSDVLDLLKEISALEDNAKRKNESEVYNYMRYITPEITLYDDI